MAESSFAYGNPLMVSAHPVQPFPSPHTSLCTPDTLSCFSLQNSSFLPQGPCRHFFFFLFLSPLPPPFCFLRPLSCFSLLLEILAQASCREQRLLSNIQGSLGFRKDEKEKPVGCLRYFGCGCLRSLSLCALTGEVRPPGAEPAAGCREATSLLIC